MKNLTESLKDDYLEEILPENASENAKFEPQYKRVTIRELKLIKKQLLESLKIVDELLIGYEYLKISDEQLTQFHSEGLTIKDIQKLSGLHEYSIRSRLKKLGLKPNKKDKMITG